MSIALSDIFLHPNVDVDFLGAWLRQSNASMSVHFGDGLWHVQIPLYDPPNAPHQCHGQNKDLFEAMYQAVHEARHRLFEEKLYVSKDYACESE